MQAVADAVGSAEDLPEEWRDLKIFAVGEATARLASDLLGLDAEGFVSQNAAAMASIILKSQLNNEVLSRLSCKQIEGV